MRATFQTMPDWAQLALYIVPGVSAIFAGVALLLNFFQSRRTNAQARAALVANCLKEFADGEKIQKAFYQVEHRHFIYRSEDFHGSPLEQEIDGLLRHFANLALSWRCGLLKIEDILPVRYYIVRVMQDAEIQKYIARLDTLTSAMEGVGQHPYSALVDLGKKLSALPVRTP